MLEVLLFKEYLPELILLFDPVQCHLPTFLLVILDYAACAPVLLKPRLEFIADLLGLLVIVLALLSELRRYYRALAHDLLECELLTRLHQLLILVQGLLMLQACLRGARRGFPLIVFCDAGASPNLLLIGI